MWGYDGDRRVPGGDPAEMLEQGRGDRMVVLMPEG